MADENKDTTNNIIDKLKYYQEILRLNILASEQFDIKLLNFPSYYSYNASNDEFSIDLSLPSAAKFLERIKKIGIEESIAITIRYTINGNNYPILIAFVTDEALDNNNLSFKSSTFRLYTPVMEQLGYETAEIEALNIEMLEMNIKDKIKYLTDELASRYNNATIVSGQFLSGVVNITSFDKIIKDKIDYYIANSGKIREQDIMYKYLNSKLASTPPTLTTIIPIQEDLDEDQKNAVEKILGTRLQTLNGPPGTGKSQTITELLLQAILLDKKILLTSYNNKPVEVVYRKVQKALGVPIPFPCYSSDIQAIFKEYVTYIYSLKAYTNKSQLSTKLNNLELEYEKYVDKYDFVDTYNKAVMRLDYISIKYKDEIAGLKTDTYDIGTEYKNKQSMIKKSKKEYQQLLNELEQERPTISTIQKNLIVSKINYQLIQLYDRDLEVLEEAISNSNRIYQAKKVLEDIVDNSPIVFGNILKSINNLPSRKNCFDYILVDEASQCNQLAILPLLYITRALVVIGDPKQLSHIPGNAITPMIQNKLINQFQLKIENSNYIKASLFNYVDDIRVDSKQEELFLSYHYRSNPDIIGFSNQNYYNNRLKVVPVRSDSKGVRWYDVIGQANANNYNEVEISAVVTRVLYYSKKYKLSEIGVISQYRNQVFRIKKALFEAGLNNTQLESVTVGTIHTFQGDEKKVIIYSPVYSNGTNPNALDFVNVNQVNIINVAVSRAREVFEVVGDSQWSLNNHKDEKELYYRLTRYILNM
jgi:superfamily I DNA and/or RNA helicase